MRGYISQAPPMGVLNTLQDGGKVRVENLIGVLTCDPSTAEEIVLISPENYIKIFQGSSVTLNLQVQTNLGAPRDLTGARVLMTVKRAVEDHGPVLQKSSVDATQILVVGTSARLGQASIFFRPADTKTLEVGNYVFDVWVIFPDGSRVVVIPPSVFEVAAGITHIL